MAQETAKERIENEIKSVDKRLHRGRNYGKTYNTGVKEGLMIARAHVIDSSTTDEKTVEKLRERCDRYEKALTEIDCSRYGMQFRRDRNPNVARQALAVIGGDDDENRL